MYVLTGSEKRNLRSNEAALKYFLMGAFATGILLFGIALLYGATGSFSLSRDSIVFWHSQQPTPPYLLYAGLLLVLIGMLFKVSAAPFHFWTPDVYDGAPTIFTAFMSTIVKTAGFAALFRLLVAFVFGHLRFLVDDPGGYYGTDPCWWVILSRSIRIVSNGCWPIRVFPTQGIC